MPKIANLPKFDPGTFLKKATVDVKSFKFCTPQPCRPVHWLTHKTLKKRLALLLPTINMAEVLIVSVELSGNASFVNYVRHHSLTHRPSGAVLDVVEKSVRKIGFITSLEARFYRERHALASAIHFQHPQCFGLIETPWESLIFTEYVTGSAPLMHAVTAQVARGIAETETLSSRYLQTCPRIEALKHWQMDFFRPWYLLRPRFNFHRFFPHLQALAVEDERFVGLESQLRQSAPLLQEMANTARRGTRCFCHMDYLRKNLFVSEQGLHLIDWSEVKVGRVGFDGGAYLSAVFRRNTVQRFRQVKEEFLSVYSQSLSADVDKALALHTMRYVFLLNALWYCMRPTTIEASRNAGELGLLREKFDYLVTLHDAVEP